MVSTLCNLEANEGKKRKRYAYSLGDGVGGGGQGGGLLDRGRRRGDEAAASAADSGHGVGGREPGRISRVVGESTLISGVWERGVNGCCVCCGDCLITA